VPHRRTLCCGQTGDVTCHDNLETAANGENKRWRINDKEAAIKIMRRKNKQTGSTVNKRSANKTTSRKTWLSCINSLASFALHGLIVARAASRAISRCGGINKHFLVAYSLSGCCSWHKRTALGCCAHHIPRHQAGAKSNQNKINARSMRISKYLVKWVEQGGDGGGSMLSIYSPGDAW